MSLVVPGVPRRRTDLVVEAIKSEVLAKRTLLDNDATVRSLTVVVKMVQGSTNPRAVIVTIETERTLAQNPG